jgi:hypothetical protein
LLSFPVVATPSDRDITALLDQIKKVGREGAGNVQASKAWKELSRCGPEALPAILAGFDGADAIAANWLRAAVDSIAERSLKAKHDLPATALEAFVRDRQHDSAARRLAYEWLARVDSRTPARLLPDMLLDPSLELRRDAVALATRQAQQKLDRGDRTAAITGFRKALLGARDRDQVDEIARKLKTLGVEVDLAAHFGFIRQWMLLGPFDSIGGAGFQKVYPPEQGIDLTATYTGKKGVTLRWAEHSTVDPYGMVDLNKAIGKHMGAAGYAFATVVSFTARPIQIRVGSNNAIKLFLNGKQTFFREEYHHGLEMDQHVGFGTLKAGRNEILIKVCQNEQTDDWAQSWSFQLRICDAVGSPVPLKLVSEKPTTRTAERKVLR